VHLPVVRTREHGSEWTGGDHPLARRHRSIRVEQFVPIHGFRVVLRLDGDIPLIVCELSQGLIPFAHFERNHTAVRSSFFVLQTVTPDTGQAGSRAQQRRDSLSHGVMPPRNSKESDFPHPRAVAIAENFDPVECNSKAASHPEDSQVTVIVSGDTVTPHVGHISLGRTNECQIVFRGKLIREVWGTG